MNGDGKRLRQGAGPSLPADYVQAVDGCFVGPSAGSCGGRGIAERKGFLTSDIATNPLWADGAEVALERRRRISARHAKVHRGATQSDGGGVDATWFRPGEPQRSRSRPES